VWLGLAVGAFACGYLLQRKRGSAQILATPHAASSAVTERDPAAALLSFLAQELGISAAAVHSPDLRARISVRGIPVALCERTAALFEALQAERYGGPPVADAADRLADLREEWRRSLPHSGLSLPPRA